MLNGESSHPLFKFLKKNCNEFYDYDMSSSRNKIVEKIGIFLSDKEGGLKYYRERELDEFVNQKAGKEKS